MKRLLLLTAILFYLVGCVSQPSVQPSVRAFDKELEDDHRVFNVASEILRSAVPMCPDNVIKYMNILFTDKDTYSGEEQLFFNTRYAIEDHPVITWVSPTGGGAKVGLQVGDKILAVNNNDYGNSQKEGDLSNKINRRAVDGNADTVKLKVERSGIEREVSVPLDQQCGFFFSSYSSDKISTSTFPIITGISSGLMRVAATDQDLALVIAHELGHRIEDHFKRHADSQKTRENVGSFLDTAGNIALGVFSRSPGVFELLARKTGDAYSQSFEIEADYLSLYFMKAANLPVENAADFWRKMAEEHPEADYVSRHPLTSERILAIEKTIDEIKLKEQNGEKLMPDLARFQKGL